MSRNLLESALRESLIMRDFWLTAVARGADRVETVRYAARYVRIVRWIEVRLKQQALRAALAA